MENGATKQINEGASYFLFLFRVPVRISDINIPCCPIPNTQPKKKKEADTAALR